MTPLPCAAAVILSDPGDPNALAMKRGRDGVPVKHARSAQTDLCYPAVPRDDQYGHRHAGRRVLLDHVQKFVVGAKLATLEWNGKRGCAGDRDDALGLQVKPDSPHPSPGRSSRIRSRRSLSALARSPATSRHHVLGGSNVAHHPLMCRRKDSLLPSRAHIGRARCRG